MAQGSAELPKPRGPLMNAETVARECFDSQVGAKWVKQNVPNKVRLGHSTVLWFRDDVLEWIQKRKESAA